MGNGEWGMANGEWGGRGVASGFREGQVFFQEVAGGGEVDFVAAGEELDGGAVGDFQAVLVEVEDFGIFGGDHVIGADAVVVAAFDHEGSGGDEVGQFGVVEGVAKVEFVHIVFDGPDVAAVEVEGDTFADPLVEVGGADGEGVAFFEGGDAHGGFAAVAEAVEGDALRIDEGEGLEEVKGALVLAEDEAEEGGLEEVGFALDLAEACLAVVGVLGGIDDVAEFDESSGELVVDGSGFGIDGVAGVSFEAVLADDEGAFFTGGKVFGDEEDAVGEDVGVDIEEEFVAGPGGQVVEFAGAGPEGEGGRGQFAEDFAVEVMAVEVTGLVPGLGGSGVGAVPELSADGVAVAPELLEMGEELAEESAVAFVGVAGEGEAAGVGGELLGEEGELIAQA